METLITFKTAKLAKELNFPQEKVKKNTHYNDFGILDPLGIQGSMVTEHYYACSQSNLQKWLREDYDIRVWCSFTTIDDSETAWVWEIVKDNTEGKGRKKDTWDFYDRIDSFSEMTWFDCYETCLEAGLLKSLNLV